MQYDPDKILTLDNRQELIDYLSSMGNVALANLYHDAGINDIHRATAAAVLATLAILPSKPPAAPRAAGPMLRHYRTDLVLRVAALNHPIMLVGPAGCGKTTIGEHTAVALDLPFYITGTVNDTHELLGYRDGFGKYQPTPFRSAFEHGGVWIADEIDAWSAPALLCANSALANGFCGFPDRELPIYRHPDFRMIATANTYGAGADRVYVGRNELDAASLDRFATIDVDYDLDLERIFAGINDAWLEHVWNIRKQVEDKKIRHVVSSRAIGMGSAALNAGIEWNIVNSLYLFKGMSASDRKKIEA